MQTKDPDFGLFRADLTSGERRRFVTVGRASVVDDILDTLRANASKRSKHHYLFIAPRGTGKTHLLYLVADEVRNDDDLAKSYVIARFPEEANRVLSYADFLLGLCEILAAELPEEPFWAETHKALRTEEDDRRIVDTIVPLLRTENRKRKRTILVMMENLNEVFTRQIRAEADIAAMRKFFMDPNGCLLMATAPLYFDSVTDVGKPFYDFFDTQLLDSLSQAETLQLIQRNLEWDERKDILDQFETLRPRLIALYRMTGGNPRLTAMLYELIANDSVLDVQSQFKSLLDRVTPFYQDRMNDLAPQERAILETIAGMRGEEKTPTAIAARMRLGQSQASAILGRLTKAQYLRSRENPADKRSRLYTIREGFFDIWLAMNVSRGARRRLPFLVRFFETFYPEIEERDRKRQELRERLEAGGDRNAGSALDLLSEVGLEDEKAVAKQNLAVHYSRTGDGERAVGYVREVGTIRPDPVGTWIVERFDGWQSNEPTVDYLADVEEMIDAWDAYRTGDMERFSAKLEEMGGELTIGSYSAIKAEFLEQALEETTDGNRRIGVRFRLAEFYQTLSRWKDEERHLRLVLEEVETEPSAGDQLARALNSLGLALFRQSRFKDAEPLLFRALEAGESSHGGDHPRIAVQLNNLAQLLQATNRLDEAERLQRRALAISESSYGTNDPRVAVPLGNLAALLQATNRANEAEPLIRRALEIDESLLGADHPEVARDLSNLATLLQETNRLNEAELLIRRALEIDQSYYGVGHPKVAIRLNNLATLLQATNRLGEAEPLMRRSLAIDESSYGASHPRVATRLSNLASLLQATSRLHEAEPLIRRALEIDEASYGPEHPEVARDLNNLAQLLQETERLNEAEPMMLRALEIDESSFGPKHPEVARDLNNLAQLFQATNRMSEAEPLMRRALEIDEASYGPEHPEVARDLNNLAQLFQATNRMSEAEPLMRRALEIDEKSFGAEHPEVARDLNNLAALLQETNRPTAAEPLMRRAVQILAAFGQTNGYNHPRLMVCVNNYAALLKETDLPAEVVIERLKSLTEGAAADPT